MLKNLIVAFTETSSDSRDEMQRSSTTGRIFRMTPNIPEWINGTVRAFQALLSKCTPAVRPLPECAARKPGSAARRRLCEACSEQNRSRLASKDRATCSVSSKGCQFEHAIRPLWRQWILTQPCTRVALVHWIHSAACWEHAVDG